MRDRISLYPHAWQALLMLLAGVVSLVASLAGYLYGPGRDELIQQALVTFLQKGNPTFTHSELQPPFDKLVVYGLRRDPIQQEKLAIKGIAAERCEVHLDLWPRPEVSGVHVYGVTNLEIDLAEGFLQEPAGQPARGPQIPVHFHEVTAGVKVGDYPRLKLEDCSGVLRRGPNKEMAGEFRLSKLNGKSFDFGLASPGEGRWEVLGRDLVIDTQSLRAEGGPAQDDPPVDPLGLLLFALVTGDTGAKGELPYLRVGVQPAGNGKPFACEGIVAYRQLRLKLPPGRTEAAKAVPTFIDWMLFGREGLWPTWLLPDEILTGVDGRLTFHMLGNRLEFACAEGPESAFLARVGGSDLPPLESLKGSIVTDEQHRPREVVLRGFLGETYTCEVRMQRRAAGRVFDLVIQPRVAGLDSERMKKVPLWRFSAHVEDFSEQARGGEDELVKFAIELSSEDFPVSPLLPPGVHDVKGRLFVRGRYSADRVLALEEVTWKNGSLRYGGKAQAPEGALDVYGRFFKALEHLWGGEGLDWQMQDMDLSGQAAAWFDEKNHWAGVSLKRWKIHGGTVTYGGKSTDFAGENIVLEGHYALEKAPEADTPLIDFIAGLKEKDGSRPWHFRLTGNFAPGRDGELVFAEHNVPEKMHPAYDAIPKEFKHGIFSHTIRRTTTVRFKDGQLTREFKP